MELNPVNELIHFLYLGASVAFFALPLRRSRLRAPWARWVCFTISGLFLILAAGGLALAMHLWNPLEPLRSNLEHYLEGLRGFLLGCVFVLLISGELIGRKNLKGEVGT
jgi:hypothetical protein